MPTERICAHTIEYEFFDDYEGELNETDIEHITQQLINNNVEGELNTRDPELDVTHRGWWKIQRD